MKTPSFLIPLCAALLLGSPRAKSGDIPLSVLPKGVEIEAGSAGKFLLEPPALMRMDGKSEKPVFEALSDSEGVARYPSGAEVRLAASNGTVTCQIQSAGDAKGLMFQMLIPLKFHNGGKFLLGGAAKDFPADFTAQHVATGGARDPFTLQDALGEGFTITTGANWQAVQYNRKFNWDVFAYQFLYDLKAQPGKTSFPITVSPFPER